MAAEPVPSSVAADGNLRVTFVPAAGNAKSVAILNGGTAVPLTYYLTPSGLTRNITENSIDDPRLTLIQSLSRPGTTSQTLDLQYVFGDDTDDAARTALTRGTEGYIVIRYAIPNATAYTTGQKVDIIPVIAGFQRKDTPTSNSVLTITQSFGVTGDTQEDVALVA
jgi:hypothetical protein